MFAKQPSKMSRDHKEIGLWAQLLLPGEGHLRIGKSRICIAGSGRSAARGNCQNPVELVGLWWLVKGCTGCWTTDGLFYFPVCASLTYFSLKLKMTFNRQPGPRSRLRSQVEAEGSGCAAGEVVPWGGRAPRGSWTRMASRDGSSG